MMLFKRNKSKPLVSEMEKTQCPQYEDSIDNYRVQTFPKSTVRIGKVHAIGRRDSQQDAFAYSDVEDEEIVASKGILLLVADGMGGMTNGAEVSTLVAIESLKYFDSSDIGDDVPQFLYDMLQYVNDRVNDFLGYDGIGRSGSTFVAIHIKNHQVHWISVGDSCIYLHNENGLNRLNILHNYETELLIQVENGEMTFDEFMAEPNKAALTSYIGAGEISLIDQNIEPLTIKSGDRIVLMSDGIETVTEEELDMILRYDVEEAALKLRYAIEEKNKRNQDNFTAIIVEDNC